MISFFKCLFSQHDDNEINDFIVRDLTPKKINLNKNTAMKQYVKRLHTEIKKEDVYNIAVSGGYGSGKTTIVSNYIDEYPKSKYTIISLGTFFKSEFFDIDSENNVTSEKHCDSFLNVDERILVDKIEKSILKQLAYINSDQECPDSNMSRIRTLNFKDVFMYFSLIFIFFSFLSFKYFSQINFFIDYLLSANPITSVSSFIVKYIYNDKSLFIILIIYILVFLSCFIFVLVSFCRYFQRNAQKVSFKINGSEVKFEDKDDLTFTKQLREIVYIFKVNDFDLVFFEDLDRFNEDVALKVIEELKELNKIINQFMKKKVTFVYLFKDKILRTHENKGKFYDYSLSVLPISTKYNSLVNLNDLLDSIYANGKIDDKLKVIASKYIVDYRSLVNLINDYDLFSKIISAQNHNKLFAMVLFKNYYVVEYDEILNNNNLIEQKFKTINDKKKTLKNELQIKIDSLNDEINSLLAVKMTNIRDLKKLLVFNNSRVNGHMYSISEISFDSKRLDIDEFFNDNFDINQLRKCDDETFYRNGYGSVKIDYDGFGDKDEFFKAINNNEIINDLESQKEKINVEIDIIDNMSVSEIFNQYQLYNENLELIDELISGGYIDRDYVDYITSPPLEDNVTNEDVNFIFSVTHNEYVFEKKIHNCEYILKNLDSHLSTPYILNIKFINYLLEIGHIDKVLEQFNVLSFEKVKFLLIYREKSYSNYLTFCNMLWDAGVILWNNYQALQKDDFAEKTFAYDLLNHKFNVGVIINKDRLVEVFSQESDDSRFLLCSDMDIVIDNLKKLKVKFKTISSFSAHFNKQVYENNLYVLNEENLNALIHNNIMDISFSSIGDKKILDYIYGNINDFFRDFYMKNENFKFDDVNIIKNVVLNNLNNDEYIKEVYRRECFIISVNKLPKKFIEDAIRHNHISPTWGNLNLIYCVEISAILFSFIIKNKQALFYSKKTKIWLKKTNLKLLNDIILFSDDVDNYDMIDIIAKECYCSALRKEYIKDCDKSYYEKLVDNNLYKFNYNTLLSLRKENIDNLDVYLNNWYKEEGMKMLNAIFKNKDLFMFALENINISDADKFEKIRHLKNNQLEYMKIAFGGGENHSIHSKTYPKIFENFSSEIIVIKSSDGLYVFKMKDVYK